MHQTETKKRVKLVNISKQVTEDVLSFPYCFLAAITTLDSTSQASHKTLHHDLSAKRLASTPEPTKEAMLLPSLPLEL